MTTTRHKISRQRQSPKDKEEMRKFLVIVAIATLALMILMYFIFV